MVLRRLSAGSGLLADAELEEIGEVIMKGKAWSIARPSALGSFLLLLVLSLAVGPVAAQNIQPDCRGDDDPTVFTPAWDADAANGTTFTMTKDCYIKADGVNIRHLEIVNGKTFIIDGAGFTIHAADKSKYDDAGTAFGFESRSNISLTLRNVTIEGGGDAASPTGGDPDPAILLKNGTLILDGVTIQNTRGGAIRVTGSGTVTLKNVKLIGNQVSGAGSATEGAAITLNSGQLNLQNLFTLKTNTGGVGAIHLKAGTTFDIYDLGCLDVSGNQNAGGTATDIHPALTGELMTLWDGKPTTSDATPCTASTASTTPRTTPTPEPAAGGGDGGSSGSGDGMPMPSLAEDGRIGGMIGSASAYFLINRGGVVVLRIYRVDSDSVGHWVMDVSQATVDAMAGAGCVASSPDGRYAVRVWADGNVTVSDGPDMENKVLHNTLRGGLTPAVISTDTTYSSTPPGVGCPGYIG